MLGFGVSCVCSGGLRWFCFDCCLLCSDLVTFVGCFGVCSCALLICVLVIKFVLVCLLGLLMLVCVPRF